MARFDLANPLTSADFAPHLDKLFSFDGGRHRLRLAVIDTGKQEGVPGPRRRPFLLIFHGPRGAVLPEGMYRADVEDGPSVELYVMPIHTVAPDRQEYQAIFN